MAVSPNKVINRYSAFLVGGPRSKRDRHKKRPPSSVKRTSKTVRKPNTELSKLAVGKDFYMKN